MLPAEFRGSPGSALPARRDDDVLVQKVTKPDLAQIGLPLQIGGVAIAIGGFWHGWIAAVGIIVHFAGDVLFYLQMKKQGCV
jgi:hypothetical protein